MNGINQTRERLLDLASSHEIHERIHTVILSYLCNLEKFIYLGFCKFIDQSFVETFRREGNFKNIFDEKQAVTFAREFFVYYQAPGVEGRQTNDRFR